MNPAILVDSASQQERLRTARRRVLSLAGYLVAVGVALVGFMIWQRDAIRIEQARSLARGYAAALRALSGPTGPLPTAFPIPGVTSAALPGTAEMTYVGPRSNLRTPAGGQIVAHSEAITRFIHQTGRTIIVADGHALRVEWIPETDFQKLLAALGPSPPAH